MIIFLLAVGGGLGAGMRYALSRFNNAFPYGTLLANVLASFFIGVCIPSIQSGELLAFFVVGFCGSLSTVSTYAIEAATSEKPLRYGIITWSLTLGAVSLGYFLAML
ncbi:CrcB family protein [Chryseomicrobium sp. FSL W7-1435]|uniref:FluC/FEX family fluoride channel n=1 Tax=Chryseomicrobium sp. FSL W7-1435 TaxID=2921704 RepID=UPI00315A91B1